jgi:hypothetical protein
MTTAMISIVAAIVVSYLLCTTALVRLALRSRRARRRAATATGSAATPAVPVAPVDGRTRMLAPKAARFLVEIHDGSEGHVFPLSRDRVIVGTASDADVTVKDPYVSARHLSLRLSAEDSPRFVDLDSTNGTFLNDQHADRGQLAAGDSLRIGRTRVSVRDLASHAEDAFDASAMSMAS